MSALDTPPAPAALSAEERFQQIYEEHCDFLAKIAIQKFKVPESEAETLAHEVFLSYLRKADSIVDLRPWLIGAICHASRYYWRVNQRIVAAEMAPDLDRADPASIRILDSLPDQIAAREALQCVSPRCQEILRLRYFEGWTMPEIAVRLGVTTKYVAKLVTRCLRRAEKQCNAKNAKK